MGGKAEDKTTEKARLYYLRSGCSWAGTQYLKNMRVRESAFVIDLENKSQMQRQESEEINQHDLCSELENNKMIQMFIKN